jgi:hypothetical protein
LSFTDIGFLIAKPSVFYRLLLSKKGDSVKIVSVIALFVALSGVKAFAYTCDTQAINLAEQDLSDWLTSEGCSNPTAVVKAAPRYDRWAINYIVDVMCNGQTEETRVLLNNECHLVSF